MEDAMDKNSRDYEVCVCRHVTRGQIEDFLKETELTDLKEICQKLNVGNVCGACRGMILDMIEEMK